MEVSDLENKVYEQFCNIFSFYIPETHRNFFSSDDLRAFLRARFDFFSRAGDEINLKIHNPPADFYWQINSSLIEISLPDSPFIVDMLLDYLNFHRIKVNICIHPVIRTERTPEGRLKEIGFARQEDRELESYIYLEIARCDEKRLSTIKHDIRKNLQDLRIVVNDFSPMLAEMSDFPFHSDTWRLQSEWLQEAFVILGTSRLRVNGLKKPFSGILRHAAVRRSIESEIKSFEPLPSSESITYRESMIFSTVNPKKRLYFAIFSSDGEMLLIIGHFSNRTQSMVRNRIPFAAEMLERIAVSINEPPNSYTRKELLKASQILPTEVLFTRAEGLLSQILLEIVQNIYREDDRFTFHADERYGLLWILGLFPLSENGRMPEEKFLHFQKKYDIETRYSTRRDINVKHVVLLGCQSRSHSVGKLKELFENNYEDLFLSWSTKFKSLVANHNVGDARINEKIFEYFNGITLDYEIHLEPDEALYDLERLEELDSERVLVNYYSSSAQEDRIKIYTRDNAPLSDFIPVLRNFGFTVLSEQTFPFRRPGDTRYTHCFQIPSENNLTAVDRRSIGLTIASVLNGMQTSEPVNALATKALLSDREISLVKMLLAYYFQIDTSHSRLALQHTLLNYPQLAAAMVALFHARFGGDDAPDEQQALEDVAKQFQEIRSIVEEDICHILLSIINGIVRTNYYLQRREIAVKIRSEKIEHIPRPVPLFEIFVYSNDIEGIHLRGAYVARGGIRWSDRIDDYRTEVLGLMKAQTVKNTLIVPEGSKGGFIIKNHYGQSIEDRSAAGVAAYRRYISSLLDLTDNVTPSGKTIPPVGLRCRDENNDAYLVVAADKGTATFSNIANEISGERNFWLHDAFASGGKNGYDHKEQGITARGAWESVRRHFLEMNVNPDSDPITIVGIGDMGGDVFGNGLLISRSVKLIAAFNHRHIFLDPDPDPQTSYGERERLFREGTGWDDYDRKLLSTGGGIHNRNSRRISVPAEARRVLGIRKGALSGEDLIRAILRAPVDMLWNGGIGTYIKASQESHYHAGDHSNDRVRVDASEIRFRVIAEGGNLGLTQAARIQAASRGVRLNTDAIDNSAGVDMSDHEVNLKILLNIPLRNKRLKDENERNSLIRRLEQDQIVRVLYHNYENNLALSLDNLRTSGYFRYFRTLIKDLNRAGLINRERDAIPYEADLDSIEHGSRTLSRPLLCSLMGFTKLSLSRQFIHSDNFHDPWYDRYLFRYFPSTLHKRFEKDIRRHPLRREIIITEIVNEILNNAGIAFFQRMSMRTGDEPALIARAYLRISEFIDLPGMRREFRLENIPASVHYEYLLLLEEKIFRITLKFLERKSLQQLLTEKDSSEFARILSRSSGFSDFRLKREHRSRLRSSENVDLKSIINAFCRVDTITDAFNIFINNATTKHAWSIPDYFHVLEKNRVRDLRRIMTELIPASEWEVRFLTRIDPVIDLITSLFMKNSSEHSRRTDPAVKTFIDDILQLHGRRNLTIASFYEMLQNLAGLLGDEETGGRASGSGAKKNHRPTDKKSS